MRSAGISGCRSNAERTLRLIDFKMAKLLHAKQRLCRGWGLTPAGGIASLLCSPITVPCIQTVTLGGSPL